MLSWRRSSTEGRWALVAAVVAVVLGVAGLVVLAGTAGDLTRRHVVSGGIPLDEVHPPAGPAGPAGHRRPGVLVAHGFAGSARLMAPFGDTLATRGYVVVLLDFDGHGPNAHALPDATASTDASAVALQRDLDIALAYLRGLPDVDPSRIALVGHSMGATAVTRFASAHPEVTATVAMSLPDSSNLRPDRPSRLLLLVGGLEFPAFRAAAQGAVTPAGPDRRAVVVPGVEHISILFTPRPHREVVAWLDDSFGGPVDARPVPSPLRRLTAAGLLLLALLIGLFPVAWVVLGGRPVAWPRIDGPDLVRVGAASVGAALVAGLVAPIAPTGRLPLALGGFVVGFTAAMAITLLAYHRWRTGTFSAPTTVARPARVRLAIATPVLIGYAALTIVAPLQLGLTSVMPVGRRWWLLLVVWAGFAALAYAAECVAGNSVGVLLVSAVAVVALTGGAIVGLTPAFLLLVIPLLAVLMLIQAMWSAVLRRCSAPVWLVALVGSLLVAWPLAAALPITG